MTNEKVVIQTFRLMSPAYGAFNIGDALLRLNRLLDDGWIKTVSNIEANGEITMLLEKYMCYAEWRDYMKSHYEMDEGLLDYYGFKEN